MLECWLVAQVVGKLMMMLEVDLTAFDWLHHRQRCCCSCMWRIVCEKCMAISWFFEPSQQL